MPRPTRRTQAAAHRPDPHAVVGGGRALQQEEHRGGRAHPARRRRPRARMAGARQLGRPDAGPASHHDQGGDAVLRQGTPALLPSLLADHAWRHGRRRRRQPPAICRRQEAQAPGAGPARRGLGKFDLLLAPSAKGEAPSGLGNTGDPIFNRFWTLLGTPCIALPFNTGPFGLPLSVQPSARAARTTS